MSWMRPNFDDGYIIVRKDDGAFLMNGKVHYSELGAQRVLRSRVPRSQQDRWEVRKVKVVE